MNAVVGIKSKESKDECPACKASMQIFCHHIYEYQKGIRNLILHTTDESDRPHIEQWLKKHEISYKIMPVGNGKINVFFGNELCISVIGKIKKDSLTAFTKEEDFILGIMLGYDRLKQCERFLDLS
jgi:hypothetical protein